jgi:hypothetical protein
MGARWTNNDTELMLNNLVDGFPVQQMMALFPNRSEGAIRLKAQDFDYGIKTSKEDGITRFYADIKSRVRHANALPDMDDVNRIVNAIEAAQLTQAVPNHSIDHLEPETRIIANISAKDANDKAVKMLFENGLEPTPKIVYYLSTHIMGGTL